MPVEVGKRLMSAICFATMHVQKYNSIRGIMWGNGVPLVIASLDYTTD